MDSRERTLLALDHQTADRLPIDFWASRGFLKRLEAETGLSLKGFLDRHDVDLRYIDGPRYIGPPLETGTAGTPDIWGVRRQFVEVEVSGGREIYEEVAVSPLAAAADAAAVEAYENWPDPDWFDYRVIAAQCEELRRQKRVVVFMGDRLNRVAQLKPAMYLRGMENIYMDLALRPDLARALLDRIREFYLAYLERILAAANGKIDIVLTGDDFGAQNGMLISPEMWRDFLKPGFAAYMNLIGSHGAVSMHHTCGAVAEIIPDLIECGLKVLQSLQPEAPGMALADLKERFGARLCFQGGISVQRTLPFGAPAEVREEVRRVAAAARPAGGYIFGTAHNVQADTSPANVTALMEAYHEFGRQ